MKRVLLAGLAVALSISAYPHLYSAAMLNLVGLAQVRLLVGGGLSANEPDVVKEFGRISAWCASVVPTTGRRTCSWYRSASSHQAAALKDLIVSLHASTWNEMGLSTQRIFVLAGDRAAGYAVRLTPDEFDYSGRQVNLARSIVESDKKEILLGITGARISAFLYLPAPGDYVVRLRGRNDAPPPVDLKVCIGGQCSIMSWGRGDYTWEEREMPMRLWRGVWPLSVTFLNDYYLQLQGSAIDRNAYLEWVELKRVK